MILDIVLTAVLGYILTDLIGYGIHVVAHKKWSGLMYRKHMVHHTKYIASHNPDKDTFLTGNYQVKFLDGFVPWFIPPFVGLFALAWWLLPFHSFITFAVVMSANSYMMNKIHDTFHVDDHWLCRFPYYLHLRRLHWVHHRKGHPNLGIYLFWFDRLFGSFKDVDPKDPLPK